MEGGGEMGPRFRPPAKPLRRPVLVKDFRSSFPETFGAGRGEPCRVVEPAVQGSGVDRDARRRSGEPHPVMCAGFPTAPVGQTRGIVISSRAPEP